MAQGPVEGGGPSTPSLSAVRIRGALTARGRQLLLAGARARASSEATVAPVQVDLVEEILVEEVSIDGMCGVY